MYQKREGVSTVASSPSSEALFRSESLSREAPVTSATVQVGTVLPQLSRRWSLKEFSDRHVLVYGDGNIVQGQWPEQNIHSDEAAAQREGLAGAVASAPQIIALIMRMMAQAFGSAWLYGARIDVKMIKPLFVNELVTTKGEVTSVSAELSEDGLQGVRVTCTVRAERLDGVPVMVGTASALLNDA
jgi:acyl dehydratase